MRTERRGFWVWVAIVLIKPLSLLLTRRDWRGREHMRRTGGMIVAANHVSYVDPLLFAHFVYGSGGRIPRFMAKIEVFHIKYFGRVVQGAGQIAVYRSTTGAGDALRDAVAALRNGKAVIIYPEGTITQDPDYWPMIAKCGVARLALYSGAPVIPVAQWGPQDVYGRDKKLRLFPRRTIHMLAGPPVGLSAYRGRPLTPDVLRGATGKVMASIRAQLGEIRGQTPPVAVWNPQAGRRELAASGPTCGAAGPGTAGTGAVEPDERRTA